MIATILHLLLTVAVKAALIAALVVVAVYFYQDFDYRYASRKRPPGR